jgi:hypothetical protein
MANGKPKPDPKFQEHLALAHARAEADRAGAKFKTDALREADSDWSMEVKKSNKTRQSEYRRKYGGAPK